jgi:transglutaminase-like putative cysteine protease
MKFFLTLICLFGVTLWAQAGELQYPVSAIDTAMLRHANAVKRHEEIVFEVVALNRARYYHKYAITILNEKGDEHAQLIEHYDKLQSVVSIEGSLYDWMGNKIKSLKKSDIQDRSGTSSNNLADDDRVKVHHFYHRVYPYTVEYEVELKYNYTMFYPSWYPVDDEHVAVEYSSFTIKLPDSINFRYKAFNLPTEPVNTKDKSVKQYKWELKKFKPISLEYKSPHWYEVIPVLLMGPVQFQIEDYTGDMKTWQDFGQFVYRLKAGRDQLPDPIKQKVHQLADMAGSTQQKIEKLYSYMQENTRYISVQLGIGGWQPYDAAYVAEKKYGDCKALTNYMYSLLKEAGIKSYYTLVKAGSGNKFFQADFPSSQFNHVILCVPVGNDTIWLECTSQVMAPGYLGDFTDDRYALLIDEKGGKLVRTPKYHLAQNLQVRHINVQVDEAGNASIAVAATYKALQQDDLHGMIKALSGEKVKEYLNDKFNLPNYELLQYDYKEIKEAIPAIEENLKITAGKYASVSGKRLFIVPNVLSKSARKLSVDDTRKYDVVEYVEYRDLDSVEIKVPAGYQLESMPKDVQLQSKFGKYSSSIKFSNNTIVYYRQMEQYSGRFSAKVYNEYVSFFEQVYKADRTRVVLVKAE